jgi:hypothetical protein
MLFLILFERKNKRQKEKMYTVEVISCELVLKER